MGLVSSDLDGDGDIDVALRTQSSLRSAKKVCFVPGRIRKLH
jgi:hypothetical protein